MDQCNLLKALYNFATPHSTTLNFSAGDYFYWYQSTTSQKNWWIAVNRQGGLGFVPSTYVAEEKVSVHFYIKFIEQVIAALGEYDEPLIKGQKEVLEQLLERKRKLRILLDEPNKSCPEQNTTLVDLGTNLARFWTKAGLGNIGEIPPPIIESDQEAQYKSLVALADQGPKYLRFNPVVGLKEYNDLVRTSTKEFTDRETQSEKKSMLLRLKRKLSFKKVPHYVVNEMRCQIREINNRWDEIKLESNKSRNERETALPTDAKEIECASMTRESENNDTVNNKIPENQGHFAPKQFAEKGIQYGCRELRSRIYQMQESSENTLCEPHFNINESHIRRNETRSSGDEIQSSQDEIAKDKFENEFVNQQSDSEIQIGRDMSKFTMVTAPVSMQYTTGNMSIPYAIVDQGPDECEWCEFGMLIMVIVFLVFVSALNMFWALYFSEGYAWGENSIRQFNFHPSLMSIGLITFGGFSILIYRICRCIRIVYLRLLHALFHVLAVPCVVVGLMATWDLHGPDESQVSHYSSLHSWLGIVTLSWFGLQSLCGFLSCIMPFIPKTNQMLSVRIVGEVHATCGLLSFVLSVCCCLTGLSENTLQLLRTQYTTLAEERTFVNLLGLVLIALLLLFLCITLPRFHYSRVPENNRVKKSLPKSRIF